MVPFQTPFCCCSTSQRERHSPHTPSRVCQPSAEAAGKPRPKNRPHRMVRIVFLHNPQGETRGYVNSSTSAPIVDLSIALLLDPHLAPSLLYLPRNSPNPPLRNRFG